MRTTLLGGLIDVLRNQPRAQAGARARVRDRPLLRARRAGLRAAAAHRRARLRRCAARAMGRAASAPVDFFDVKGDLEALAAPRALTTERGDAPGAASRAAPRACWSTARRSAGSASCIRGLPRHFELPRAPVVFELDLDAAARAPDAASRRRCRSCPSVRRDLAVVVDETVPAQDVLAALEAAQAAAGRGVRAVRRLPRPRRRHRARKALRFWCLCKILNVL